MINEDQFDEFYDFCKARTTEENFLSKLWLLMDKYEEENPYKLEEIKNGNNK